MKSMIRTYSEREKPNPPASECSAKTDSNSDREAQKRHISSIHSDCSFLKFLNEDRQKSPSFCDLTVSVCGRQFSVHKVVLAFGSSYFHTQICRDPETSHMTVDHMDDTAFQHLLCFLYTSEFVVSDSEIPRLVEAARFLNMGTAVELLRDKYGSTTTASPVQREAEPIQGGLPAGDTGPQSPPAGGTKAQGSVAASCSLCSRTFRYQKSLEKHMARSHISKNQGAQGEETIETVAVVTTRRSARQRKTPAKFEECDSKKGTAEGKANRPTLKGRREESDSGGGGQDDEDEEGGNEEDNEQDTVQAAQTTEALTGQKPTQAEGKILEGVEMVIVGYHQEYATECRPVTESSSTATNQVEPVAAAGRPPSQPSGSSTHTYPEGLAPLVIQTSNKKTLQCPKCDKTFDRIGG